MLHRSLSLNLHLLINNININKYRQTEAEVTSALSSS